MCVIVYFSCFQFVALLQRTTIVFKEGHYCCRKYSYYHGSLLHSIPYMHVLVTQQHMHTLNEILLNDQTTKCAIQIVFVEFVRELKAIAEAASSINIFCCCWRCYCFHYSLVFFFFTFFPLQLGLNLECMIRERVSARVSVRSLGNEKPIELANHHCRRHRIWQANLSAIHILMKQTEIVCMLSAPHS